MRFVATPGIGEKKTGDSFTAESVKPSRSRFGRVLPRSYLSAIENEMKLQNFQQGKEKASLGYAPTPWQRTLRHKEEGSSEFTFVSYP